MISDDPRAQSGGGAIAPPPLRLSVGVTGHRLDRLDAASLPPLADSLEQVLRAIEQAAGSPPPAALRLVTGLADGADTIGADGALARGWRLDVVLPFAREEFATDFTPGEARASFVARLEASAAVMELPGDRDATDGHGLAYERAGRIMLAQSDILLAIWDGGPARGRGGSPQIIAEAILQGVPVIHLDAAGRRAPVLLWDGLEELDLGQQTVDTVARGSLDALPDLVRTLLATDHAEHMGTAAAQRARAARARWTPAIAYPLLLAVMGVRRPRLTDFRAAAPGSPNGSSFDPCSSNGAFAARLRAVLAPRFVQADAAASRCAQLFRSVYVTNFALAAVAVVLSMAGLALPPAAKPVLIVAELATIGAILVQTRAGNRAAWHQLWLDHRSLAERLRCLAIAAQLGDLELRAGGAEPGSWVTAHARSTARELGLPSARVDNAYLACVRDDLTKLIDGQVAYMAADARRMHRLEHRLHLLGTILFALTALTCVALLAFKTMDALIPRLDSAAHAVSIGATIFSAALPAIGAAIYGIRMQGDFAGSAERSHRLGDQLARLKVVITDDELAFDTLSRRVRRVTGLLTEDLAAWLQAYRARPLVLPG